MDDYMFQTHVDHSKVVTEATTYLEIFNYAVSRGPSGSGRAGARSAPGPACRLTPWRRTHR